MFTYTNAVSDFSVDDLETANAFYGETLGVDVREEGTMGLSRNVENNVSIALGVSRTLGVSIRDSENPQA